MSNYILSATLELKDQFTAQVNKARSGFRDLTGTLRDAGIATDSVAAGMGKAGTAASRAAQQADKAKPFRASAARMKQPSGQRTTRQSKYAKSRPN